MRAGCAGVVKVELRSGGSMVSDGETGPAAGTHRWTTTTAGYPSGEAISMSVLDGSRT